MDDGGKALYLSSVAAIIAGHGLNACGTRVGGKFMPANACRIFHAPFYLSIKELRS
jgi:hypothetical protein